MKAAGDFSRPGPLEERLTRPVATAGVSGALAAVGHLVLDPGDPVLVPDRRWDGYDTTFGMVSGARLVPVRLLDGAGWDLDAWRDALLDAARERGRAVCVVNFPHNPTGYSPSRDEAEAFAQLAAETAEEAGASVVVVCDDAYEGYVYADRPRASLFYRLVDPPPAAPADQVRRRDEGAPVLGRSSGRRDDGLPPRVVGGGARDGGGGLGEQALGARPRHDLLGVDARADPCRARALRSRRARRGARAAGAIARRATRRDDPRSRGGPRARRSARIRSTAGCSRSSTSCAATLPWRHGSCCPNRRSGSSPSGGRGKDLNALRVTYATVPVDRIDGLVTEAAKAARASGKSPGET